MLITVSNLEIGKFEFFFCQHWTLAEYDLKSIVNNTEKWGVLTEQYCYSVIAFSKMPNASHIPDKLAARSLIENIEKNIENID